MRPKNIKLLNSKLVVTWHDNSEKELTLEYMRNECPCADCKGETILWKTYRPVQPKSTHPDMYKIKDIRFEGNYGLRIEWMDGHDTGIYSWEYLSELIRDQESGKKQDYIPL
ncbi:MAG TPA: DUF971 domain-containing protein [Ignavibacteriaceae bacterium]|nr:DUF971 domain-containing protein [Ignavibacteriaceae bacterium]